MTFSSPSMVMLSLARPSQPANSTSFPRNWAAALFFETEQEQQNGAVLALDEVDHVLGGQNAGKILPQNRLAGPAEQDRGSPRPSPRPGS